MNYRIMESSTQILKNSSEATQYVVRSGSFQSALERVICEALRVMPKIIENTGTWSVTQGNSQATIRASSRERLHELQMAMP
jgi:hypothetical protein